MGRLYSQTLQIVHLTCGQTTSILFRVSSWPRAPQICADDKKWMFRLLAGTVIVGTPRTRSRLDNLRLGVE
jgi:hypothetical protein